MKISKHYLVLACLLLIGFFAQAQDQSKIQAIKVAFLTERLALSSDEAEVFWPLYNEYNAAKQDLRSREKREIHETIRMRQNFSESEARSLIDKFLALEREEEALQEAFIQEMSKALSARKTLMLFRAEADFKRQLLKRYGNRSGSRN